MTDFAAVVEDRGRAVIRAILDAKERTSLGPEEGDELRAVVVDQVSGLYRLAASLVRNLEGQMVTSANFSQLWLEAIGAEMGIDPPVAPEVAASSGNGHGRPR